MHYDVIIVGAGVAGLMTAIELHQAGLSICMLEKGSPGRESSWAGGGILLPLYPWRYPGAVNHMAQWSISHYPQYMQQLHTDTGIDPEYFRCGHLILDTEPDMTLVQKWSQTYSIQTEQLNRKQLQTIEPGLSPTFKAGLYAQGVSQVRPPRLMQALDKRVRQLAIPVLQDTPLCQFRISQNKVTGITTPSGDYGCANVLIAAGAWSGSLDFEGHTPPSVEPVKGQMIQFQTQPGTIKSIVLYQHHYIIPRKDGKVLAGSTLEYSGFNKDTDSNTAERLRQKTVRLFPNLQTAEPINHWGGLRPGNQRHTPYVCEHPHITGLYFNTGHYRNGIVLGLASARLVTDIMLGNTPILPTAPYRF